MTATEPAPVTANERSISQTAGVADILARVDRLLGRAVDAAASSAGSPADALRGLFISDADAGRLVQRGSEPLGNGLAANRPIVELRTAAAQWRRVAGAFELSLAEIDVLALALAPELDLRYERIYGYLHDDITKRRLTPDLACQLLCDSFDERLAARRLFAADAPLRRCHLVHLAMDAGQPDGVVIGRGVRLDEGMVEVLLGDEAIDRRLATAAQWDAPSTAEPDETSATVRRILRAMRRTAGAQAHVVLVGSDARLKTTLARQVARELEQPLLIIDLHRLAHLETPFAVAVLLAARTAHLAGALALWTRGERVITGADTESAGRLDAWLAATDSLGARSHLLAVAEPASMLALGDRFLSLELPMPDGHERQVCWERAVGERGIALAHGDAALLAEVFRMDGAAIDQAVDRAVATARWRNAEAPDVTITDLFAAGRLQSVRALPRYATRVELAQRWEDIVLPPDCVDQLRELCNRIRHRHLVLGEWGFSRRLTFGAGSGGALLGSIGHRQDDGRADHRGHARHGSLSRRDSVGRLEVHRRDGEGARATIS